MPTMDALSWKNDVDHAGKDSSIIAGAKHVAMEETKDDDKLDTRSPRNSISSMDQVWIWKGDMSGVELLPVVGRTKTSVTVEDDEGEERILDVAQTFPFNEGHLSDCNDAADMNDLHEPALVGLLQRRFGAERIYTFSGDVLISVNPYKTISNLYTMDNWETHGPHVYAVAKRALDGLPASQAILVNGESGAGKTEATKRILNFLAALSQHTSESLPAKIMTNSNPALEAFGNAVTIRNDNSSRFGKYVKIWFDEAMNLRGISMHQFLLEQSRLISHANGERNYHIFYQLIAGARQYGWSDLQLHAGSQAFSILRCDNVEGLDTRDFEDFEATVTSLKDLGIGAAQITSIWRLLAGLLHLGNVEFVPSKQKEEHATLSESAKKTLAVACSLLGINGADIERVLLQRSIGGKSSVVTIPLSVTEAFQSRNGFIKTVYSRTFAWIVEQTTHHDQEYSDASTPSSIGILDIFGFEVLEQNSLEQLCVNFANEELQRLFNWHVFELEKSRYAAEGISWDVKACCDNQELLAAIRQCFTLLEEQGRLGARASDQNLIAQLDLGDLVKRDRVAASDQFIVKHFAASVTYKISGFLEKNNDALQADLSDFLVANAFVESFLAQQLFPRPDEQAEHELALSTGGRGRRQARKMASINSVSSRFRGQMAKLVEDLQTTQLHFVRCVKPNMHKNMDDWDTGLVVNQLRHLGVMEAVRIRQEGFPVTVSFEDMVENFGMLLSESALHELSMREAAELILSSALGETSKGFGWQVGTNDLVFMTKASQKALQHAKYEDTRRREELARIEREIALMKQIALERQLQQAQAEVEAKALAEAEAKEKARKDAIEAAAAAAVADAEAKAEAEAKAYALAQAEAESKAAAEAEAKAKAAAEAKAKVEAAELLAAEEAKAASEAAKRQENAICIQSWWRMITLKHQMDKILQARGPWQDVLEPNEAALLSSFVVHSSESEIVRRLGLSKFTVLDRFLRSKKRRGLILTTSPQPRLLLVDPNGSRLKVVASQQLDPSCTWVHLVDEKTFDISFKPEEAGVTGTSAKEWSFTDILGCSTPWAKAMARPQTVKELMSTGGRATRLASTAPILWQGSLKKYAIRSKRNRRVRWFVLQMDGDEAQLLWYKTQSQTSPQGALLISKSTEICDGYSPSSFVVKSPVLPVDGLRLEASSERDAKRWRTRLQYAQSCSLAEMSL